MRLSSRILCTVHRPASLSEAKFDVNVSTSTVCYEIITFTRLHPIPVDRNAAETKVKFKDYTEYYVSQMVVFVDETGLRLYWMVKEGRDSICEDPALHAYHVNVSVAMSRDGVVHYKLEMATVNIL